MTDEHGKRRSSIGWGIPASILLHAVFAFVLFFHLPLDFSEPQKEESVSVEIVPPPEEPEQKAEEPKLPEATQQEEAAKKEEPPPEVKQEEPPPPPPEPAKQDEAKKEEPPPPPPPEPKEEQAQQPEPPPPPQTPQEEARQDPPPADEQAKGQPIPVLRPVFEFGEKDGGPRKSETGNASQEAAQPAETKPDAEAGEPPKPSTEDAAVAEAPPADAPPEPLAEEPVTAENPPGSAVPDDVNVPQLDVAAANPQQDSAPSEAAPDATKMEIVTPPPAVAKNEPPETPPADKPPEMAEAKRLFSELMTGDPAATKARGSTPRGVRAGELCATELREQLRHGSPSYRPEMLPAYRLPSGTVLEVRRAAFRASGQWYDLSFRCSVDEDVNKVTSFAFDVGAPVPRSEWRKRGFPEF